MNSASQAPLFSDGGQGAFKLLAYLALATGIMLADHRQGYLGQVRSLAGSISEPMFRLAELPARVARWAYDAVHDRSALLAERETLRQELLVAGARLARMESVQAENDRLQALLQGTRRLNLEVRLARLADVDLDPFRHRVQLDIGAHQGVQLGMAVMDAGGVFGQVIDVAPQRAMVMLLSDPAHAIPVQVQRTGMRAIAFGTGEVSSLQLPNIPQSSDIRRGDRLLTSGLGGRFPAGLPVAVVSQLRDDDTRLFVIADAEPTARLDRSNEVLLVWQRAAPEQVGPPAPTSVLASPPVEPEALP